MKRMGFYSGTIYSENDLMENNIHECCRILTEEEEKFLPSQLKDLHLQWMKKCEGCLGCPMSRKEVVE